MKDVQAYVSVNAYIEQRNKILLVRVARPSHKRGMWGLPGGKVLPNETFEEALEREIYEETGLGAHLYQYEKMQIVHTSPESTIKHIYRILLDEQVYEFNFNPDEIMEVAWVPLKEVELKKYKMRSPWVMEFLREKM